MNSEEIYQLILQGQIEWESLITTIIREEGIDPLNIDLGLLTSRFVEITNKLAKQDFIYYGKFIYVAAILLRLKSERLLDKLLNKKYFLERKNAYIKSTPFSILLTPKMYLLRKKRITLADLIFYIKNSLRFIKIQQPIEFNFKLNEVKVAQTILNVQSILSELFKKSDVVLFSELTKGKEWKEVARTFISLLFLFHDSKIAMMQKEPMAEIEIRNVSL
jgi:chromatin segregation and condensation protein Rec8/ScpA/Scc1 (kleisin family)